MVDRITVEQAAQAIGASPQFVRRGLQQKTLPIGSAVRNKKRWSYNISAHLLELYTGKGAQNDNHQ